MKLLLCALLLQLGAGDLLRAADSPNIRGRVRIVDGNVVTDRDEPLRGAPFFMSVWDINDMRDNEALYHDYFNEVVADYGGINVVRIAPWIGNWEYDVPGNSWHTSQYAFMVEKVVQWAEEAGVYVIINLHMRFGTNVDPVKVKAFWDTFAPLYKDKTHVIFEILNEPDVPSVKAEMAGLYRHVRSLAPDTHIINWSLASPLENFSVADLAATSGPNAIEYDNASVGFHSYPWEIGNGTRWDAGKAFRDAGFPIICTEFHSLTNADYLPIDYAYLADGILQGEQRGISWIQWAPRFNYRGVNLPETTHEATKFSQAYVDALAGVGISVPFTGAVIYQDALHQVTHPSFIAGESHTISVPYSATQSRDILVALEDVANNYLWVAYNQKTVAAGTGTVQIPLNLKVGISAPGNYRLKVVLIPVSGTLNQQFDSSITPNLTVSPPVDTDGDNFPDAWESANSFDPHVAGDVATRDSDGDGDSDLLEIFQGTGRDDPAQSHGLKTVSTGSNGMSALMRKSTAQSAVSGTLIWSTDLVTWHRSEETSAAGVSVRIDQIGFGVQPGYEITNIVATFIGDPSETLFLRLELGWR